MTKIKVTQQQRDNLLDALNVLWPSVPEANVYPQLRGFRSGRNADWSPTCGTIACFGGWCAWWPAFRAQGVSAWEDGSPRSPGGDAIGTAVHLFGDAFMFAARGGHNADLWEATDHEIVTRRLKWLLANSEVSA